MIERESTGDGWQVPIHPPAAMRWLKLLPAAFLSLWLCGWAAGEYFAGGMLLSQLCARFAPDLVVPWLPHAKMGVGGPPSFVLVFLGVWVTFWTLGGIGAMGALVSLLFGEMYLRWSARGVEVATVVGPFTRRKALDWDQVDQMLDPDLKVPVLVRGSRAVVSGSMTIARWLPPEDAQALRAWLREARSQETPTAPAEPSQPYKAIG